LFGMSNNSDNFPLLIHRGNVEPFTNRVFVGKYFLAKTSSMTVTVGDFSVSCSLKKRPCFSKQVPKTLTLRRGYGERK
jgi:hypothetical protein